MAEPNGESTLQHVFPGTTITFSNGRQATFRPWSAWDILHRVPARIGAITAAVLPAFTGASEGGDARSRLPTALVAAAGSCSDLICEESGFVEDDLKALTGADLGKMIYALIEQNLDFFVEVDRIRGLVAGHPLTGPTSPPPS